MLHSEVFRKSIEVHAGKGPQKDTKIVEELEVFY